MPDALASSVGPSLSVSGSAASGAGLTVLLRDAVSACCSARDWATVSRVTVRTADTVSSNPSASASGAGGSAAELFVTALVANSTASGLRCAEFSPAGAVCVGAPASDSVSPVSASCSATAISIGSGAGASRAGETASSLSAAETSDVGAAASGSTCNLSRCTIRAPPLGNSVSKLKTSSSSDSAEARSMRAFSLISARRSRQ